MSMSGSRDNVLANLLQQGTGILLFLLLPRILNVHEYSQLTVLVTLISLSVISDLGISHIYTRKMPGLLASGKEELIQSWDVSVLVFRGGGALIFGVLAGIYFGVRTESWVAAVVLVVLVPVAAVATFVVSRCVVSSSFREVKLISMAQSLGRLFCLPGALAFGVGGWLGGQVLSALSLFVFRAKRRQVGGLFGAARLFDWTLIQRHAAEAFVLCLIATVWTQLAASGRLFAVLHYPDEVIAAYGLAGALYQIGISVITAALVPQTVRLYRLFSSDLSEGIEHAFRIAVIGSSVVLALSLLGVLLAPLLFNYLFAKYQVEASLLTPLILSMPSCAVVSVFGSVFIGTGKARTYLAAMLLFFVVSMVLPQALEPWFAYDAAALAQLIALSCFSVILAGIAYRDFGRYLVKKHYFWITILPPILAVALGLILARTPA